MMHRATVAFATVLVEFLKMMYNVMAAWKEHRNRLVCEKDFVVTTKNPHKRYCSCLCATSSSKRKTAVLLAMTGNKNHQWKGDAVKYKPLHNWVRRHLKKPKECQMCGSEKRLDLANISQEYKRDFSDWEWLCRKCHMEKDGRLKAFINYPRSILQRNSKGRFMKVTVREEY